MSAEGWANFIALLALAGSAVGFWLNRREIRGLRDAAAEVRWSLSPAGDDRDRLLLTNLGTNTAHEVEVDCVNAVKVYFEPGDIGGRSGRIVSTVTAWGLGPRELVVSWSAAPGVERATWRRPFTPTSPISKESQ
ncbi:hypothetical protein [Janibacter hoylei]|uniref:hypothetical protein n=1 Tax=Janibacter hoylei TaxID=364298 RepID=UPI002490E360|nr:hypothetical protein [Janibacter hoylei]